MTSNATLPSHLRILLAAVIALSMSTSSASAQTTISAIAGAGYERAWIDGDFSEIMNYSWFEEPTTSDAVVFAAGLWAPGSCGGCFGALARIGVARLTTEFIQTSPEIAVMLPDTGIVLMPTGARFPLTLTSFELELLGTLMPVDVIGIGLGGSIGYRRASNFESTQSLPDYIRNVRWTNPSALPLRDDGRTMVLDTGTIPQNGFSAAAVLSLLGDIRLGRSTAVVPELRLRYDLTSPFKDAGWSRVGVAGMLSLRVTLGGLDADPPGLGLDIDQHREELLAPPTVRLYAIGDDGSQRDRLSVRPTRAEVSRATYVLPVVAKTSAEARRLRAARRLRSARSAADARAMLDSVVRHDAPAMIDDAAGMVGLVLRAHPEGRARLRPVLAGSTHASAMTAVDSLRADILARFEIDPSQLIVETTEADDFAIESNGGDVFAAVFFDPPSLGAISTTWIEQGFVAQAVKVEPSVASNKWRVILERGATAFDTLRGGGFGPLGVRLRIPFARDGVQQPIVARLLTDGGESSTDTLEIDVIAEVIDRRRSVIDLPGARERGLGRLEMRDAIERIGDRDRVIITGADADSVGRHLRIALGSRTNSIETHRAPAPPLPSTPATILLSERTRIVVESLDEVHSN